MLSLARILISDLVVANLLMYSLPGMILLYLAAPFFTPKVFLDEIYYTYLNQNTLGVKKELPSTKRSCWKRCEIKMGRRPWLLL